MTASVLIPIMLGVFGTVVGAFVGHFVLKDKRLGGLAGALVGEPVRTSTHRVEAGSGGFMRTTFRAHSFATNRADRAVGFELGQKAPVAFARMVAGLSVAQAEELVSLLKRGLDEY